MVTVMVPSPLSTMVWSWPVPLNRWVRVPPVSRLVVTAVPRVFST